MYLVLIGLAALSIALLVAWRKRSGGGDDADAEAESVARAKKSPYHAVSVRIGESACLAAKTIEGKRFLAAEAPQLPLAECSSGEDCRCRFVHHEDRRAGRDRRSPFAPSGFAGGTGKYEEEQRKRGDRRADQDDNDLF